jgi:iron complex transport system ATP-binding protein
VSQLPAQHTSRLLHVEQVRYQIRENTILNDIAFALAEGEVLGLIGPNGAGKSTLFKILTRHWTPSSGQISICDHPLGTLRPMQLARWLGYMAQTNVLDAAFTVEEVVLMGRNPYLGRFEIETSHDRAIARRAMQTTHILHLAERQITALSGGERQRVFLARALAQEPAILLLDEPTSNLDIRHQIDMLTLIRQLTRQRGLGVLMAIHDLALAARFCDRLILLCAGHMVAVGTPEEVLTPAHLACAFEIEAQPYRDPFTHDLKLSILHTGGADER